MTKKFVIVAIISLVLGGIIGGIAGSFYTTRTFARALLLLKQGEIYKAQDEAWKAYTTGTPQIAEWELYQAIALITDARGYGYPDTNELNQLEFESEARLALLNRSTQNQEGYNQHVSKALLLAQQIPCKIFSGLKTEDHVVEFITKWDEAQKTHDIEQAGPGYPPQGVGSPDP